MPNWRDIIAGGLGGATQGYMLQQMMQDQQADTPELPPLPPTPEALCTQNGGVWDPVYGTCTIGGRDVDLSTLGAGPGRTQRRAPGSPLPPGRRTGPRHVPPSL